MDTSDSEYFESADEDMQSDGEICEKVEKKEKKSIETLDSKIEDQRSEVESGTQNCKTIVQQIQTEKNSKSKGAVSEENKDKSEDIAGSEESKHNAQIEKNKESIGRSQGKNITVITSKIQNIEIKHAENETEEKKIAQNENVQVIEDENLWNDGELDWGVEGAMEIQSQKSIAETNLRIKHHAQSTVTGSDSSREIQEKVEEKRQNQSDSWGGWSSWGASVLTTATQSVSSITSQLTNVIESSLGAVDPEELAKINREEKRKLKEAIGDRLEHEDSNPEISSAGFGLGNLVKLVENTGSKVISGGLDTLETIGKKTMEVLQEGDPGLKNKRAFLKIGQDKPVLSQILREAKEKAENESHISEINYETLFDDHQGLVHLEALELLSKQCEIKLQNIQNSLSGEQYNEFLEAMDQVVKLFEIREEDDEEMDINQIRETLTNALVEMEIQMISYEELAKTWMEKEVWLNSVNLDTCDEKELHKQAIETLAQITSLAMERFQKIGTILMIRAPRNTTCDEAVNLELITSTLTYLIGIIAQRFSEKLNSKMQDTKSKEVSELITNVFFEAANSSSYLVDALQLLIPIVQVGAVLYSCKCS